MKWFILVFVVAVCVTRIVVDGGSLKGRVYLDPTDDVSFHLVDGWKVIKESAYPNSRIVIQCDGGECTGHWELIR